MNDDPKQRELIGLLLTAGQNYWDDPVTATARIRAYFRAQCWNNVEILWRMAHAVCFVEQAPAFRADFENVLVIWRFFKDGAW